VSIANFKTQSRAIVGIQKSIAKIPLLDGAGATNYAAMSDANWFNIVSHNIGVKPSRDSHVSPSFSPSLTVPEAKKGNERAEGPLSMNLLRETQEWLYQMILGGDYVDGAEIGSTGFYPHDLIPNALKRELDPIYINLEKQVKNKTGVTGSLGHRTYVNGHVDTLRVSIPQDGPCLLEAGLFFEGAFDRQDDSVASGSVDAPDEFYMGHRGLFKYRTSGTADPYTTPDYVKGADFTIDSKLIKNGYTFNSNRDLSRFPSEVAYGQRSVTGTIDCFFTSDAAIDLAYKDFSGMEFVIELAEGGYVTEFTFPNVKIMEDPEPDYSQSDDFVVVQFQFQAFQFVAGADTYEMKVKITDKIANYPDGTGVGTLAPTWPNVAFTP
jgi:hypothetical protein